MSNQDLGQGKQMPLGQRRNYDPGKFHLKKANIGREAVCRNQDVRDLPPQ
jgi:hypothetical protein